MAFESTAIHDLIAGVQQKPLQRDSDDWLFGERDDATQIDPHHDEKSTTPFDRRTPPAVSLPSPGRSPSPGHAGSPFGQAPALEYPVFRSQSPTTHVRMTVWSGIAKKLALPIGLFCIVVVIVGVYFAKTDSSTPAAAANLEAPTKVERAAQVEPAPSAEPTVTVESVAKVEPTNPEPVAHVEPAAAPVAPAAPVPAAAPAAAAAPVAAAPPAPAADPKHDEPKPAEPEVVIEPGSPASRFLATAPVEPTIPTAAPRPAPAPTAVAGLASAKPAARSAVAVTAAPAKPAPTNVARKSAAQLRPEKRAAAKVSAKPASVAAKARTKKVAAASDDAGSADEAPAPKPAAASASGKGVLAIASSPSMQVWVDGRNSKAMTPVRILLRAGKHRVSLLDNEHGKARSFDVEIKPDETLKVSKNYE